MICGFFGHKDTPDTIRPALEQTIKNIILQNDNTTFYVGNQGKFDNMVFAALKMYAKIYQNISYYVVLAYLPNNNYANDYYDSARTLIPDKIESIMPKYAISYRNKWIANQADTIICHIRHSWGGAAQYVEYARKRGKVIFNLAETENLSQNTEFYERQKCEFSNYNIVYFITNQCFLSR